MKRKVTVFLLVLGKSREKESRKKKSRVVMLSLTPQLLLPHGAASPALQNHLIHLLSQTVSILTQGSHN
jgi:hypothetical protein